MESYQTSNTWRRYRALLAERFDLQLPGAPVESWRTIRGHDVHIDDWRPPAPEKGTLILVHGAGGHGRLLAPFGAFAVGQGWRAIAPDLPGCGLTRVASDFRWDYAEWPAVVAELAKAMDGPVVFMGMSVGGLTAAFAAEALPDVDGVIATTLLDMGDRKVFIRAARWRWLAALSLLAFRFVPSIIDPIALPLRFVAPMKAMTSDEEMQDYFVTDPLLGGLRVPARFFRMMHARKAGSVAPGCPLLLVHPGADAWTVVELSRAVFERIRGPKRLRFLSNGSHLPLEEPAFDELTGEVAAFLEDVLSTTVGPSL